MVLVAVQLSVLGLYLPPVLIKFELPFPPQMMISLPVHTAVWKVRASGALVVLVAVQLSVLGLYLPPVFKPPLLPCPPQTIISLPVHTAVCRNRATGALVVLVANQVLSEHCLGTAGAISGSEYSATVAGKGSIAVDSNCSARKSAIGSLRHMTVATFILSLDSASTAVV